jgi:L-gulonolactone oxidase
MRHETKTAAGLDAEAHAMRGPKLTEEIPKEYLRLVDWSGFTDFGGEAEVFAPRNESDICSIVRYCRSQDKKLRVVALRTSWNALWYSPDVMMTANHLNAIKEIIPENHTVTCEPGITLEELHRALWAKGLALGTAPAPGWVTLGGALSTGSHGSGLPSISSSMIGCRLVTADGEVIEIGENDERLDAVRLSLGMLGVMSTVTLRVVDTFYVKLAQTRIPTKDWKRFLTEGEMSYLLWFAHTDSSVMARVDIIPNPAEKAVACGPAPQLSCGHYPPPETGSAEFISKYIGAVNEVANMHPWTFPARSRYVMEVFFPDGEVMGPMHEILMSFQAVGPIAGAEWCVPLPRFPAAMADLEKEIANGLYLPAPVWLKKVKPETAWLSAADEDCVQCGIYHNVNPGTPWHVRDMVSRVERLMLRHGGRPHLGKLIYLSPAELKSVYPNWSKFDALRREMDPTGIFWTDRIEERFGA